MATGVNHPHYKGKVSVTFGDDLLEKVNAKASREGVSFAEAVRRICNSHFRNLPETPTQKEG